MLRRQTLTVPSSPESSFIKFCFNCSRHSASSNSNNEATLGFVLTDQAQLSFGSPIVLTSASNIYPVLHPEQTQDELNISRRQEMEVTSMAGFQTGRV